MRANENWEACNRSSWVNGLGAEDERVERVLRVCVCVCVSPVMLQVLLFNPLTLSSFHLLTCLPLFSHTLLCVYVCERICLYLMCFLQPE